MMLPSAGWLAIEYARNVFSLFAILRSQIFILSQSSWYSGSTSISFLKSTSHGGMSIWMYPPDLNLRCSPSGSLTTNSLIKVATLWLLTTSHSHFLIPRTSSGITISMSSFTLTWQPRRHWLFCCFLVKKPVSVGRISPPPFVTRHLHMPQVPPPPQAEGRNIFSFESVERSDDPGLTVSSLSPLIVTLTLPEGVSFAFAYSSIATSNKVTASIAITATVTIVVIFMILLLLQFNTHKAHKGQAHETYHDKCYS